MRSFLLALLVVGSGCSLVLDTSPPDPQYISNPDGGRKVCDVDEDCDDGFACNGLETCADDGLCSINMVPATCDDGVDCTADVCGSDGVCTHQADDTACSDGFDCTKDICLGVAIGSVRSGCYSVPQDNHCAQPVTVANACARSVCAPAAMEPGDDPSGCVLAPALNCDVGKRCNFSTFQCEALPDGCNSDDDCNDGDPCNGVETCVTDNAISSCMSVGDCADHPNATCERTVCNERDVDAGADACLTVRKYDTACIAPVIAPP
jgi:hypothetical protein